jgi:hypothetical protein
MAALDANWDYYSASSPRRLRFGEGRRLLELPRSDLRLVCGDCRRLMVHQPEESLVLDAFSVERISKAAIHESSQEFRKLAIAILVGSCTAEQFPELHAAREQLEERATE